MSLINGFLNAWLILFEALLRFSCVWTIRCANFFILMFNAVIRPWHFAKCFVAWDAYHTYGFYRLQFDRGGAMHAARWFYQKNTIAFFYEYGARRNPWLRVQVWFLPWTVRYPMLMDALEEIMKGQKEEHA